MIDNKQRNEEEILFGIIIIILAMDNICGMLSYFMSAYSIKYQWMVALFKIPSSLEIAIAIIYILLIKKKVILNKISIVFFAALPLGMIVGIVQEQFNSKYFVHIYVYLMPIIMMSFAYGFYQAYKSNQRIRKLLNATIIICMVLYAVATLLFRYMYHAGMLRHNNYGPVTGNYILPFFVGGNGINIVIGYMVILFNFIAAKRTVIVCSIAALLVSCFLVKKSKKNMGIQICMLLLLIIVVIFLLEKTNIFSRILVTINGIFSDNKDLTIATSGRNLEIECIMEYLNRHKWMWVTGIGFGGRIWIHELYRHYSHFTPLGYVMTGGVFLSLTLYLLFGWYILQLLVKGIKRELQEWEIPFALLMLVSVLSSFFGASLFTSSLWWFFIGIAIAIVGDKTYTVSFARKAKQGE